MKNYAKEQGKTETLKGISVLSKPRK